MNLDHLIYMAEGYYELSKEDFKYAFYYALKAYLSMLGAMHVFTWIVV